MRIFLLGSGYVGTALLHYFQSSLGYSHKIIASTTSVHKKEMLSPYADEVVILRGDEQERILSILERCDAMIVLVAPKEKNTYQEIYLRTALSIQSALQERKKPFYLLYTSSTSVYEGQEGNVDEENTLLKPYSDKAKVLLETETVYEKCANERIAVCILRLGGIYGPGREISVRAGRVSGKTLQGTGSEPTHHIHLEDIVRAIDFFINRRIEGVYNLVNDDHPSRSELYFNLCSKLQINPPQWNMQKSDGHGCGCKVSNLKILDTGFVFLHPHL